MTSGAGALSLLSMIAMVAAGCSPQPSARLTQRRLDGPRPPYLMLRCVARGLKPPVKYAWRFAPGVKQIGWNVPMDESAFEVGLPDGPPQPLWAECTAFGAGGVEVHAARSLVAPSVSAAPGKGRAGELVTVRGAGFGPSRGADDALWLVPAWGRTRALDHGCKGAVWSDAQVSACLPAATGTWQLRVQAGGDLAIAPLPLTVTP